MKESDNRKTALVAGAGALLCLLYAGVGTPLLFRAPFGAEGGTGETAFLLPSLFHFLATSVLFLALPLWIVTRLMEEKPSDYGWGDGDQKAGLNFFLIGVPLVLAISWFTSARAEFQREYPLFAYSLESFPLRGGNIGVFSLYQLAYLAFYMAWEFFFRGFLLFGLKPRLGAGGALLAQAIPSALLHYYKPGLELTAAFPGGIIFGLVALRCRSLKTVIALHWLLGFSLDLFILIR